MKKRKLFIGLLAAMLAGGSLHAQGLGFYLGGKKVELTEGDSIKFVNNSQGEVEVKVAKDGQIQVYRGEEMTFYGDIERYFLDVCNAMHFCKNFNQHNGFGYGAIMHVRDVMTADLFRTGGGYNWFETWASDQSLGENATGTVMIWNFYENAITACNKLIGAINESKANDKQKEYLGVAYAFRAMHYLDMARMYEYLPCYETKPYSNTGKKLLNLTVPIITEKTTAAQLAGLTRAPREEMKAFIESDLEHAARLLDGRRRTNKLLPNLACVYGLLARLNMWVENYATAAQYARMAINQSGAVPLTEAEMLDVENGFNTTAPSSWMWGAQPRSDSPLVGNLVNWPSWMCNEADFGYVSVAPVSIMPSFYNQIRGEDIRRKLFKVSADGSEPHLQDGRFESLPKYASLKFRPYHGAVSDIDTGTLSAYPLMRVEEMYFIEAEAKAHVSLKEGVALLNDFMCRYRMPNKNYHFSDEVQAKYVIQEIVRQKRIELWGEGQSYFDYKRLDMPVDRTQEIDMEFLPYSQTLCCGIARPAWMNFVFPSRSRMQYQWNSIGQENPDPSGRYTPGGGSTADVNAYYNVQLSDGIVRELFNIGGLAEFITVKACPMDTAEGFVLQEPFKQLADSTMMYSGDPIAVRLNGAEAFLPLQPLGFYIGGEQVMVKSTQNGTYADGVVTFPKNSITVSYGNVTKVVNSKASLEIRIPGSQTAIFSVYVSFYDNDKYRSEVFTENGMKYLRAHLSGLEGLDEVRLVCVPPSQAEAALALLKSRTDYGVAVKETGLVNIPMIGTEQDFAVVGVGLSHGSIACSKVMQTPLYKYPNYTADIQVSESFKNEDGTWKLPVHYNFGPQVDKGYIAFVDKYATGDEIKAAFEAGTLPSCLSVNVVHRGEYQTAMVPYPAQYGEYKLAALSLAHDEVVEVGFEERSKTYDCPARRLSVGLTETESDSTSVTWKISYHASDFDGAYIALLPDSLLKGNVWENVLHARYKAKVSGVGTANLVIVRPKVGEYYTIVLAGCDAEGRILKDVNGGRFAAKEYSDWCKTKAEWLRKGYEAGKWPLAESNGACRYVSAWYDEVDSASIAYRVSNVTGKGQFKIEGNAAQPFTLVIEYDPATNRCQVLPQYVDKHSAYGNIYVADIPHYVDGATYEGYPCLFNPQSGTISLTVNYYVSVGTFGTYTESIQVYGPGYATKSLSSAGGKPEKRTKTARIRNLRPVSGTALKRSDAR